MIFPDPQTEEVAEVRGLPDCPELPSLSRAALRARLSRAAPLLAEDPAEAIRILTAPPASASPAAARLAAHYQP